MNSDETKTIPVTIISGYLGSGKTTLINHLLRHAEGKKLAVMVNDFGDLPIDADLIEAQNDDLISLSGGCVCCSYGSGMMEAFGRLESMDPPPDHIVLETSGVAIPSSIASALMLADWISLEGIVCLADAATIEQQFKDKYLADTIERQLTDADIILLNKTDLVTPSHLEHLRNLLSDWLGRSVIIQTEQAMVSPQILLQDFGREDIPSGSNNADHLVHYETTVLTPEHDYDLEEFTQELFERFPNLVRAKGFVRDETGQKKTLQVVGRRVDISPAPSDAKIGLVVIILRS